MARKLGQGRGSRKPGKACPGEASWVQLQKHVLGQEPGTRSFHGSIPASFPRGLFSFLLLQNHFSSLAAHLLMRSGMPLSVLKCGEGIPNGGNGDCVGKERR